MFISKYLKALIHELQQLYKQLSIAQLHKRMQSYHNRHSSHSHAVDIKLTLSEYINSVITSHENINTSPEVSHPERAFADTHDSHKASAKKPHLSEPYKTETDHRSPNLYSVDGNNISELSKYFKRKINDAELHPAIEDKLRRSVWEHINAAIQCALQGDRHNAKMHIDIASYAFKEVAHYMPEDQYSELTIKLDEHLNALTADNQHARQSAVNSL